MAKNEKTTAPVVEFSDLINQIAAATQKSLEVLEGGVLKSTNKDLYEQNLPEKLTMESVRAVHDYDRNFMVGTELGFGRAAVDLLGSHENIQQVSTSFHAGRDKVSHTLSRDGRLVSGYTVYGTTGAGGEYKKVADYIADSLAARLNG